MIDERTPAQTTQELLVLIGLVQKREETLKALVNEQLQLLHRSVQKTGHDVNRVVEDALPRLRQLSQAALDSTLVPAVERFAHDVQQANAALQHTTERYASAQHEWQRRAMRRLHLSSAALLAASLLAFASGGWLLWNAKTESARLRSEVAYLDRVNRADWVPCGQDRLCARIDAKADAADADRAYRAIALRR